MQLVNHSIFLEQLAALFESKREHGSIWLTHKRFTRKGDGEDAVMSDAQQDTDTREYPCLIRATDGRQVQFSTLVESSQLHKFHAAYGRLLKSSMITLRKRDKKREKQRAEQAARRKQRMVDPIEIEGPKRGSGRKKRQRRIKAALKQEESRRRFHEREEGRANLDSGQA